LGVSRPSRRVGRPYPTGRVLPGAAPIRKGSSLTRFDHLYQTPRRWGALASRFLRKRRGHSGTASPLLCFPAPLFTKPGLRCPVRQHFLHRAVAARRPRTAHPWRARSRALGQSIVADANRRCPSWNGCAVRVPGRSKALGVCATDGRGCEAISWVSKYSHLSGTAVGAD
jgi:hypothetical protein